MSDYKHVVAAIDLSRSSDQVLIKARDIARRNNARLSLLHVVEYIPPMDYGSEPMISNWGVDEDEMQEQAERSLQNISKRHDLENADVNVLLGTPKHEISQFIKEQQCDLVVLGSHGRHGISLLLGSTANAVLHDMPCDILAVKIEE